MILQALYDYYQSVKSSRPTPESSLAQTDGFGDGIDYVLL